MLYLLVGGIVALILAAIFVKATKFVIVGWILACAGAGMLASAIVQSNVEDHKNAAKCASIDGSYGGNTCFVSGVEKDLENLGL